MEAIVRQVCLLFCAHVTRGSRLSFACQDTSLTALCLLTQCRDVLPSYAANAPPMQTSVADRSRPGSFSGAVAPAKAPKGGVPLWKAVIASHQEVQAAQPEEVVAVRGGRAGGA